MSWKRRIIDKVVDAVGGPARILGPPPVGHDGAMWTVVSSQGESLQSERLLDVGLAAAGHARTMDLSALIARTDEAQVHRWIHRWPGEHYPFLAGLARELQPASIVEVGTHRGISSLAFLEGHPAASVVTYDLAGWTTFPDTLLRAEDFERGLEQRLGDLAEPSFFAAQQDTLRGADLVFVDAPKDGVFEQAFVPKLLALLAGSGTIVVLDDIHFLNMWQLWRDIPLPKLDLTSLAHWSGTGLVEVV